MRPLGLDVKRLRTDQLPLDVLPLRRLQRSVAPSRIVLTERWSRSPVTTQP
jgi:hypothetical protein